MLFQTDVLIIGSGIAGLYAALKIPQKYKVTVISKQQLTEANTNYAQGGIAAVMDKDDSFENHINDTLIAGADLCNPYMVDILVKEGPDKIVDLIKMGTNFTMDGKKLDLAREGGHSDYRIVHAADLTGAEVLNTLINNVKKRNNIELLEYHLAIDLLTEHNIYNLKNRPLNNRRCWGAYVMDVKNNVVKTFTAKTTMLASGGMGQVYLHTTNPIVATGDGYGMAYRAGVQMANMEFVQFHPTSLFIPSNQYDFTKPSFLISEAVRGFGGILRTSDGKTFMEKYDPRKELAPRDIVARAIDSELKKRGDEFVYLDVTHHDKQAIKAHFPHIYATCLEFGINMAHDYIPVVPAAHYSCGGIVINEHGKTSLQGLFASGEASMTGVHGANRLASNSLLEALVFSNRAAATIAQCLQNPDEPIPNIPDWDDTDTLTAEEKIMMTQSLKEVKQVMSSYVGIVRSDIRLERAATRIHNIYIETEVFYKKTKISPYLIELRNLIACSHMIIKSAQMRKESRGLHYTIDYEQKSDVYKRPTFIQNRIL